MKRDYEHEYIRNVLRAVRMDYNRLFSELPLKGNFIDDVCDEVGLEDGYDLLNYTYEVYHYIDKQEEIEKDRDYWKDLAQQQTELLKLYKTALQELNKVSNMSHTAEQILCGIKFNLEEFGKLIKEREGKLDVKKKLYDILHDMAMRLDALVLIPEEMVEFEVLETIRILEETFEGDGTGLWQRIKEDLNYTIYLNKETKEAHVWCETHPVTKLTEKELDVVLNTVGKEIVKLDYEDERYTHKVEYLKPYIIKCIEVLVKADED